MSKTLTTLQYIIAHHNIIHIYNLLIIIDIYAPLKQDNFIKS